MNEKKAILIIGDWFIDENWLVAKHNAYNSSHSGDIHYLSMHNDLNSTMVSLCGVPAILGNMISLLPNDRKESLYVFGLWNKEDGKRLKCIICDKDIDNKKQILTPYVVRGLKEISADNKCVYDNENCSFHPQLINMAKSDNISTNRIVRIFEKSKTNEPHILCRYDWVLNTEPDNKLIDLIDYDELVKIINNNKIEAVIIEDHNKGFISEKIIEFIIKNLKEKESTEEWKLQDVRWYVRAKNGNPTWLEKLQRELSSQKDSKGNKLKIRLRVIDYMIASDTLGSRLSLFGNELGRSSLEVLGTFSNDKTFEHGKEVREKIKDCPIIDKVAILFEDNTVIAKDGQTCYSIASPPGKGQAINIGRTTRFFSELISQDIKDRDNVLESTKFGDHCKKALSSAYKWSKNTTDAWKMGKFNFYSMSDAEDDSHDIELNCKEFEYNIAWAKWNFASEKQGITVNVSRYENVKLNNEIKNEFNIQNIPKEIVDRLDNIIDKCNNGGQLSYGYIVDLLKKEVEKDDFENNQSQILKAVANFATKQQKKPVDIDLRFKLNNETIKKFEGQKIPNSITDSIKKIINNNEFVFFSNRGFTEFLKNVINNCYLNEFDKHKPEIKKAAIVKNVFQLWRGEGAIKKYICVGSEKRDQINKLLADIANFSRQKNPAHPFNCLLTSGPGWGKSFLAKRIAEECGLFFMEFSVSQMATANDLIDSFDAICSLQSRDKDKKVLVFIDEVNCLIEGNHVMGLLLSPIWDGSFIRDGKYYRLAPAVWIFASTEPIAELVPSAEHDREKVNDEAQLSVTTIQVPKQSGEKVNKGSDFVSRLSGPIIELDAYGDAKECLAEIKGMAIKCKSIHDIHNNNSYKDLQKLWNPDPGATKTDKDYIRTEIVYLCVFQLNQTWGPITQIEKQVLWLFYNLVPINGFRSLEFFISKFQYIQRGIVRLTNVPLYKDFPELLRHVIYPPEWVKETSDRKNNEESDSPPDVNSYLSKKLLDERQRLIKVEITPE